MDRTMELRAPEEGASRKAGRLSAGIARMAAAAAAAGFVMNFPMMSYAFEIPTVNVQNMSSKFSDVNQVAGVVIGLGLWVCQMVGIGMIIWGVYGYVTARKDGEAEAMNGALSKLIGGAVLLGMKGVLSVIGIL